MFRDSNASIQAYPVDSRFSVDSSSTFRVHQRHPRFSAKSSTTIRQTYKHSRFSIESSNTDRQRYSNPRDSAISASTDRPHHTGSRFSTDSNSTIRQHPAKPRFSDASLSADDDFSSQADSTRDSLADLDTTDELVLSLEPDGPYWSATQTARVEGTSLSSLPSEPFPLISAVGRNSVRDSLDLASGKKEHDVSGRVSSPIWLKANNDSPTSEIPTGGDLASDSLQVSFPALSHRYTRDSLELMGIKKMQAHGSKGLFWAATSIVKYIDEGPVDKDAPGKLSSRMSLLRQALAHAHKAVSADMNGQIEVALSLYEKTIETLDDLIGRGLVSDDLVKLAAITNTYSMRRMELVDIQVLAKAGDRQAEFADIAASPKSSVKQFTVEDRDHELLAVKAFTESPVVEEENENSDIDKLIEDLQEFWR